MLTVEQTFIAVVTPRCCYKLRPEQSVTFLGHSKSNSSETYMAAMFRGDHYMALKLWNEYASQLNKEGILWPGTQSASAPVV